MRQTADDEPVKEWSTASVAPTWLQELPSTTLAILVALALLVLVACLALLGRRRRRLQIGSGGRLCVLHAGDQESARAAQEIAGRLRALGGAVTEIGDAAAAAAADPGAADVTLCVLTPTIFAAERVRAHLALLCREAAVVIPVHSGDCHPRDDLIQLIGCGAAELLGRDVLEESEAAELHTLQRYLFRENIRDVHNSAHGVACAATLEQLVVRAAEVSSQRASSEAVPAAHYKHDVFISYHARDAWDVFESTFATLEGLGASVFNPSKDLQRTQVSSSEMVKHVQGSRCLLQVLTPNYVQSKWCRAELAAAEAADLPIYVLYAGKKHTQAQLVRLLDATPEPGCKDADAIQQARETIRRAVQRRGLLDVYNPDFAADTAGALEAIAYAELVGLRCRRRLRLAACAVLILLVLALFLCAALANSWRQMQLSCLKGDWKELQDGLDDFSGLGRDAWFLGPMHRCLTRLTTERDFELIAKNRQIELVPQIADNMTDGMDQNDTIIVSAGVRAIKDLENCSQQAQDAVKAAMERMGTNVDLLLRAYEALQPCAQNRWGRRQLLDPCGTVCNVTMALANHSTDVRVHSNAASLLRNIANSSIQSDRGALKGTALASCPCVATAATAVREAMVRFPDLMLQRRSCQALAALAALEAEPARQQEAAAQLVSTLARFNDTDVRSVALDGLSLLANRSDMREWLARNATALELAVAVVRDTSRLKASVRVRAVNYLAQLAACVPETLQIGATPGRSALAVLADVAVRAADRSVSDLPPQSAFELLEQLAVDAGAWAQLQEAGAAEVLVATILKVRPASPSAERAMKLLWFFARMGGGAAMCTRMVGANATSAVVKVLTSPFVNAKTRLQGFEFLSILSQVPGVRRRLVEDGAVRACTFSLEVVTLTGGRSNLLLGAQAVTSLLSNLAQDSANLVPVVQQGASKYCFMHLRACLQDEVRGCNWKGWAFHQLARYANETEAAQLMVHQMLADDSVDVLEQYVVNVQLGVDVQREVLHLVGALVAGGRAARTVLECTTTGAFYMTAAGDFEGDVLVQRGVVNLALYFHNHSEALCSLTVLGEVAKAMAGFPQDVLLHTSAAQLAYAIVSDSRDDSDPKRSLMKRLGPSLIETLRVHSLNNEIVSPVLKAFSMAESSWGDLPTEALVRVTAGIMQRVARARDELLVLDCMAVLRVAASQGKDGLTSFTTLDATGNASSPTQALIQTIQVLRDFPQLGIQAEGFRLLRALSTSRPGGVAMVGAQVVPLIQKIASGLKCQYVLSESLWIRHFIVVVANLALAGLCDLALAQAVVLSPAGCGSGPSLDPLAGDLSRVMLEQALRFAGQPVVRDALLHVGFMPALRSAVQAMRDSDLQHRGIASLCVSIAAQISQAKAHRRRLVLENVTELLARGTRQCGAVAQEDRAALTAGAVEALSALAEDPAANALLAAHGALGILRELFGSDCLQLPLSTDADSLGEAEALPSSPRPHIVYLTLRLAARMASAPDNVPRMLRDGAVELVGNLSRGHAGDLNVVRGAAEALHALAPGAPACGNLSAAARVALAEGRRLGVEALRSLEAGACRASAGADERPRAAVFLATGHLQDAGPRPRARAG